LTRLEWPAQQARAGVEVVEGNPLIKTFVSRTTPGHPSSAVQELGAPFLREAVRPSLSRDLLPEIQKRRQVIAAGVLF
jgi:hypothetical protein